MAIQAWNMMGGTIDWAALPVITEMLGIEDIELFIRQLVLIRDFQK
jgi:hypothetical protein